MSRWLVTGATGLLGANAGLALARTGDVVGVARRVPPTPAFRVEAFDLADPASRSGLIDRLAPDVVLHTAALASIEACEADPDLATRLNADAAADLAGQAAAAGVPFVHISTDAVFDGERGHYVETDTPSPTSVYGRSKLEGERRVLDAHPGAMVARVNFYGWSPSGSRSLAEFFHSRLSAGQSVRGFTDVHVCTLHVGLLVSALTRLVEVGASGVVHVVSSEPTSKFAFGQAIARTFGLDPGLVEQATAADTLATRRGSHLELVTDRAAELLGAPLPDQSAGLAELSRELIAGLPHLLTSLRAEGA